MSGKIIASLVAATLLSGCGGGADSAPKDNVAADASARIDGAGAGNEAPLPFGIALYPGSQVDIRLDEEETRVSASSDASVAELTEHYLAEGEKAGLSLSRNAQRDNPSRASIDFDRSDGANMQVTLRDMGDHRITMLEIDPTGAGG